MKHKYLTLFLVLASFSISYCYANDNTDADNTAKNVRDRNGANLTAQDQSNQKSSIKTTAKLRREIMRTKGLSVDAQNIKIIDKDGCIVLRGPVENNQEKSVLSTLARNCCGVEIINELEVKTP